jgi:glycerol-3-phosphate cytidylyltransferase
MSYSGKVTLTYGTFDVLHYGHINLLQRISLIGLPVFVGLSTDNFNSAKGKKAFQSYDTRRDYLSALKSVTTVFEETSWEQKITDVEKYNAKFLVMGDDWTGKFDYLSNVVEVIYLPRTKEISSTAIRNQIQD